MKSLSEKIIVVMTLVGVSVLTYQVLESLYICMKDIVEYNDLNWQRHYDDEILVWNLEYSYL